MKARLAALAVLALFAVAAWRYAAGMQQVAAQGEPAPDFTLATLDDTMVSLSDFRGRPVLLNFWATWCPPCIEEAPALDALHRRYGDRLTILGIDHLEAAPAVAAFRNRFDLSYPLLLDRTGRVSERYSVRGLPETWMIDPGGTARIHRTGAVTFEEVQEFYRQVTGQSIDGDGVGPVPAGQQAFDLVVVDEALAVATDAGLMTAEPGADVGLADRAAWSADAGLAPPVYALARAGDGSLWAAGADGVWVRTPAAGGGLQPWRSAGLQGLPVMGLGLAPDRDRALAWVPGNGLYRLEGGAWTVVPTDLDPESIGSLALAADPAQPGRWLAGFAGGLLESRDDGVSWRAIGPEQAVVDVLFAGDELYLASDRGLWHSRDGGITAEAAGGPLRAFTAVAAGGDGRVWALAPNGDLYRRRGDGDWQREERGAGTGQAAPSGGYAAHGLARGAGGR